MILDSGGVLKLAVADAAAVEFVARARSLGFRILLPTPILAEVNRGGHDHARVDRVVNSVDELIPLDAGAARQVGILMARTGHGDIADATVVVEAARHLPAIILTSDAGDMHLLLDELPEKGRISVFDV